ncbi:MAG: hypothetical protein RDV41_01030 [Planctomycetota bacterium]|nr:hypothetical protein [Planctomycetota bacterium]
MTRHDACRGLACPIPLILFLAAAIVATVGSPVFAQQASKTTTVRWEDSTLTARCARCWTAVEYRFPNCPSCCARIEWKPYEPENTPIGTFNLMRWAWYHSDVNLMKTVLPQEYSSNAQHVRNICQNLFGMGAAKNPAALACRVLDIEEVDPETVIICHSVARADRVGMTKMLLEDGRWKVNVRDLESGNLVPVNIPQIRAVIELGVTGRTLAFTLTDTEGKPLKEEGIGYEDPVTKVCGEMTTDRKGQGRIHLGTNTPGLYCFFFYVGEYRLPVTVAIEGKPAIPDGIMKSAGEIAGERGVPAEVIAGARLYFEQAATLDIPDKAVAGGTMATEPKTSPLYLRDMARTFYMSQILDLNTTPTQLEGEDFKKLLFEQGRAIVEQEALERMKTLAQSLGTEAIGSGVRLAAKLLVYSRDAAACIGSGVLTGGTGSIVGCAPLAADLAGDVVIPIITGILQQAGHISEETKSVVDSSGNLVMAAMTFDAETLTETDIAGLIVTLHDDGLKVADIVVKKAGEVYSMVVEVGKRKLQLLVTLTKGVE